ncbi:MULTISPECIES: peptidoglycan DD-metalloendopeptidase family protein [Paenibacillus]|uniref:peptidoglycan DD-metalloendopeptidase family protein n=1 Tax=Paenibacillus TaxID=44249 RepID=UPI0022B88169|nr:peptidoglycan DD-metalloendopeptidase family protein [Paenibacillus caseinilyticus]MCZ8521912.1 peptidoglycan DD-metalloendopeptidase family protein [Paenibacillus caseinilyticus]
MTFNRKQAERRGAPGTGRSRLRLLGLCLGAAGAAILVYSLVRGPGGIPLPARETLSAGGEHSVPSREPVAFRMTDPDHGWIRYADGWQSTSDGGATWTEGRGEPPAEAQGQDGLAEAVPAPAIASLSYKAKEYPVKGLQFASEELGWALVGEGPGGRLLVTADGGASWQAEVTDAVREAFREAKRRLQGMKEELPLYDSAATAKLAFQSEWLLLPESAAPGDAVLVRHKKPGSVYWDGRTYVLQPYGAGYFTYLPIGMDAKPGNYPIGDRTLAVTAKTFPKQDLRVTEELNAMRQDTKRIAADQALINKARSVSEPRFLSTAAFLVPVEGRLTTPYGHRRYVNGKFSGAHLAVDLAAPEGTPVKAANDGIVALSEPLYLTGNSIYIDHGMGLFSQYAHLSKLQVKAGDKVKRGDVIGLVGTTGFSTGPHLHFTFWMHNVQVNPTLFWDTTPFHWLKHTEGEPKKGEAK